MADKEQHKKWHALYVSSRQEKKVAELLLLKGLEAYVPLVKTMRQWSDRKKMVEFPLLNGYVFVYVDTLEQQKVLQTRGVVNYVRIEGKIAVVRPEEIQNMKQLVSLGYQMEVGNINAHLKEGDKVKVNSSILKGVEGFVVENKEGRYIEVVLESIGQSIRVKLPHEILVSV
ncbi:MAG: UpxY family transcription antiterminator [Bacteroidetes bacterium]|nr:UpxY family transcription antiterminator [Bacteroidota bacterium]